MGKTGCVKIHLHVPKLVLLENEPERYMYCNNTCVGGHTVPVQVHVVMLVSTYKYQRYS